MIETETKDTANRDATPGKRPLPDGWRWVRLGDVVLSYRNGFGRRPQGVEDGPIVLRLADVSTGTIDLSSPRRSSMSDQELAHYRLNHGDVLFVRVNGSSSFIGRCIAVDFARDDVAYNDHLIRVRLCDELDATYLKLYCDSPQVRKSVIEKSATSAGQLTINQDVIAAIPIPLPPLAEQQRIAATLTEQMAAVERARVAAEAQLEAARELPAAYLRTIFESDEARQWPEKRLGDVLQLRKEVVYPKDNPRGAATFVGLEHVASLTGLRTGAVDVEMSQLTGRKPRFYKGDIVYGYLRPYLNKVWVAEFDGLCSVDQYVYHVLPDKADTEFVAWFMRSDAYLTRAPIDTTPGQLPRIRTEEVASVLINLPPLDEQQRIVAMIAERMAAVEQMRVSLDAQLKTINNLPATLLEQGFSGEL